MTGLRWAGGVAGATGVHAVAYLALVAAVAPEPQEQAPRPETSIDLAMMEVARSEAREVEGEVSAVEEAPAAGARLGADRIRQSEAADIAIVPQSLSAAPPSGASLAAAPAEIASQAVGIVAPEPVRPAATTPETRPAMQVPRSEATVKARPAALTASDLRPVPQSAAMTVAAAVDAVGFATPGIAPGAQPVLASLTVGERLASAPSGAAPLAAAPAAAQRIAGAEEAGQALDASAPDPDIAAEQQLETGAVAVLAAAGAPLPETAPAAEFTTAALAWSGGASDRLDEGALEAAEAFLVRDPGGEAQELRDGIAATLAGIACARVQTAFDPETGAVELRGHVPRPEDRAMLAEAINAELGGALPVVDRLLELPRPQCQVLSGLSGAGIPQSTEQFTDPRLIGENTHARAYGFREGETMQLDLAGADYDGWLYLDFYDSSGQVLHLTPNDVVGLTRIKARSAATFGGGGGSDLAGGRLQLVVSPPFGRDIAVAMVASTPLFDDLRPTQEPASDYLAALGRRVGQLRAANPDFKAEWVYLFVETSGR